LSTLVYIHDPMCSWCWAFSSALEKLLEKLPAEVGTKRLLAGLAPDSREPMPAQMRDYIRGQWRQIQRQIPGTRFNFDFWTRCVPRRSTYPACRAVIAARRQGESFDEAMTRAIQRAYYLQARNPSDTATLLELAGELGLDVPEFERVLDSRETEEVLMNEICATRKMGVRAFPGLVLVTGAQSRPIEVNYLDHRPMLAAIGVPE
jgi:putative protein-disulfide isomerase